MNEQAGGGGAHGAAAMGKQGNQQASGGVADGKAVTGRQRIEQTNKVDVMEVYSPPRVTVHAGKHGLKPGDSLDLVAGYDFNNQEDRYRAWAIIIKDEPRLVIGSPECKMFSALHNLSTWTTERQATLNNARKHLKFICEIYEYQTSKGR